MRPPERLEPKAVTTDAAEAGTEARLKAVEARIAGMLHVGALVAVALLIIGVVGMLAAGISPDVAIFPVFHPATVLPDLLALRPEGFLWAGTLIVIATPILRVLGEAVGFAHSRERWPAAVAAAILAVILASVVSALLVGRGSA